MATLGVSAPYYSIVKKWLLNFNTAERAWNHTEGHWHDPWCDPDILTNNTIVHSHRADCLPITCSWNYPQHYKWSKCHLAGSWNFMGLMRNGSAQHVKGQPCHVWGGPMIFLLLFVNQDLGLPLPTREERTIETVETPTGSGSQDRQIGEVHREGDGLGFLGCKQKAVLLVDYLKRVTWLHEPIGLISWDT